ncbi:MAG: NAD-dependent epimerase/dehydratase family protein [Candidatus Omnitrophota bacterium]|nr:MAG: NAD-dependent epimerase/dehydratase family protein [Candidatus Omnitrophota bacterium]
MDEKKVKSFFRDKRVVITGGAGFIGSNLAIKLVGLGAKVTLIDSMIPEYGGNLFNIKEIEDKINLNLSDVRDTRSMDSLIRGAELMFNLAGQVSHIDSMKDPYTDLEINAKSQLSMLESCRKYNPGIKVVFASTRQIYGRPEYLPVDERHPLRPRDVNGINKLAGEWYHVLYHNTYGIRTVCLRMTNTYGPRLLMKHNRQGFIGWFIRRVIDGEEIRIYGTGRQKRDLNYVDDVVDALLICGCNESLNGEIFNLGNFPPISLEEIAKLLIKINTSGSYRLVPFPEEKEKIDIGDYYASYEKFKKKTGWSPRISYEEGFKRTMEYYKKNRRHYWQPQHLCEKFYTVT